MWLILISSSFEDILIFWNYNVTINLDQFYWSIVLREHTHTTIAYTFKQVNMSSHACNYDLLYLDLQVNTINHIIWEVTLIWHLENVRKIFSWCNSYCDIGLNNVANKLLRYLRKNTHSCSFIYLHILVFGADFII